MGKKPILTIVFALILALMLAACDSGGDDKTPVPTATPEVAPQVQPPSESAYLGIGFSQTTGPVSVLVDPDSPAERAGLRDGDVIQTINDEDITAENIVAFIRQYAIGDVLHFVVTRGEETREFDVTLEAQPEQVIAPISVTQPFLGVTLRVVDGQPPVIEALVEDSLAVELGLRVGDIITTFNGVELLQSDQVYEQVVSLLPNTDVTFTVLRGSQTRTFEATLREPGAAVAAAPTSLPSNADGQPNPLIDDVVFDSDGTILINSVVETATLARLGFQNGDRILAINGEQLTPEQINAMVPQMTPTDKLMFTLIRDSEGMEMETEGKALVALGFAIMNNPNAAATAAVVNPSNQQGTIAPPPFANGASAPPGLPGFMTASSGVPTMGMDYIKLNPMVASQHNMTLVEGALVSEIMPNSAAEQAGLQLNDVIIGVDGNPVDSENDLTSRVATLDVGTEITLSVVRGEETLDIELTLQQPSAAFPFGNREAPPFAPGGNSGTPGIGGAPNFPGSTPPPTTQPG